MAASSQADYFLAHIAYSRASPGISSFALQRFSKPRWRSFLMRAASLWGVLGWMREKTGCQ